MTEMVFRLYLFFARDWTSHKFLSVALPNTVVLLCLAMIDGASRVPSSLYLQTLTRKGSTIYSLSSDHDPWD